MKTIEINSYKPKLRDYCNTIVVDKDSGIQYIYDSDGVYTIYTSKQQEGATEGDVNAKITALNNRLRKYIDSEDDSVLQSAKDYTDNKVPTDGASKQYVDQQDAATLQSAKDYTDAIAAGGMASKNYVDQQDILNLQSAKSYTDGEISTLSSTVTAQIAAAVSGFAVITMTDTDPGEGVPLAANHFIAVYQGDEESE